MELLHPLGSQIEYSLLIYNVVSLVVETINRDSYQYAELEPQYPHSDHKDFIFVELVLRENDRYTIVFLRERFRRRYFG